MKRKDEKTMRLLGRFLIFFSNFNLFLPFALYDLIVFYLIDEMFFLICDCSESFQEQFKKFNYKGLLKYPLLPKLPKLTFYVN